MKKLPFESLNSISHSTKELLKERLKGKKNITYIASGRRIREGYEDLPFDNVVLVDKCFPEVVTIKGKIICIGLSSVFATALFKELGIKYSALVCINEGLAEGGGSFNVLGNWSYSNILPIMEDEYLLIACPDYYGQRKWKKMFDLPQEPTLLSEEEISSTGIDPKVFSDYYKYSKEFCVWRIAKQADVGEPASFICGKRLITVQRKNIWEDYDVLDSLFVRCSPPEAQNLKSVAPKIEILKNFSFERILQFCNRNKIKKLGLSPWLRGEYNKFLEFLESNKEHEYPKSIHMYHLNQNDFQQLYQRAFVS